MPNNEYKLNECFKYIQGPDAKIAPQLIKILSYDKAKKLYKIINDEGEIYKMVEKVIEIFYVPIDIDEFLLYSIT